VSDLEVWAVERELGVELPRSYRAFLLRFGAARVRSLELFGIPRNGLWGDVVLMTEMAAPWLPPSYVVVGQDPGGRSYFLSTSHMDETGECPVVVFTAGRPGAAVASTFLDFLWGLCESEGTVTGRLPGEVVW
jgi:hypothetical protein